MKKEKTIILEIINSAKHGGGTKHLLDLVRNLSGKGYEFHIAVSPDGPYTDYFKKAGCIIHKIDMMSGRFQRKAGNEITALIKSIKPAIIHAHGTRAAFFVSKQRKKTENIPFIYTVHGLSYNKNIGLWSRVFYRQVERYICTNADKIISVSSSDGKEMIKNEIALKKKLVVIENGVDTSKLVKIARSKRKPKIIGCVARLTEQKGVSYLIEALSILKYIYNSDLRAVVAGDGKLAGDLKTLSEKMGVSDRIEWRGETDDVIPLYKIFDIFVLPSLWEGLPLVLIEAMASGLPVISTDTSGGRDIIKNKKNGLLVPRADSEALVNAILEICQNRVLAEKMASNGRRDAVEKYSIGRFVSQTEEIYKKIK